MEKPLFPACIPKRAIGATQNQLPTLSPPTNHRVFQQMPSMLAESAARINKNEDPTQKQPALWAQRTAEARQKPLSF